MWSSMGKQLVDKLGMNLQCGCRRLLGYTNVILLTSAGDLVKHVTYFATYSALFGYSIHTNLKTKCKIETPVHAILGPIIPYNYLSNQCILLAAFCQDTIQLLECKPVRFALCKHHQKMFRSQTLHTSCKQSGQSLPKTTPDFPISIQDPTA